MNLKLTHSAFLVRSDSFQKLFICTDVWKKIMIHEWVMVKFRDFKTIIAYCYPPKKKKILTGDNEMDFKHAIFLFFKLKTLEKLSSFLRYTFLVDTKFSI